jgi:DNA topoisomerase-1
MSSDSDEDKPLIALARAQPAKALSDSEDEPLAKRAVRQAPPPARKPATTTDNGEDSSSESDEDDDRPLSQRMGKAAANGAKRKREASSKQPAQKKAKPARSSRPSAGAANAKKKKENLEPKWQTLEHAGVLFPPEYEPHGVKMLYDGKPVDLTPEQVGLPMLRDAVDGFLSRLMRFSF